MNVGRDVVLNKFGYYELAKKPTLLELKDYYASEYYQGGQQGYLESYSSEELLYIENKIERRKLFLVGSMNLSDKPSLLDVGAGEGFTLHYFKRLGWQVTGLDYSEYGCKTHNAECLDDLIVGDIIENLSGLIHQGRLFDIVWLDHVLEHLLDPGFLLMQLRNVVKPGGAVLIEVPNDFSRLQEYLLSSGKIDSNFWVCPPHHISYFNVEGLTNLCREHGWQLNDIMGDFPIDFFLVNPDSNYVKDQSKGKGCHQSRIEIDNLFHSISPQLTNEYYKCMAKMGLGREIVASLSLANE